MRLNNYITENMDSLSTQIKMFEDAINNIKRYGIWKSSIIWRGFKKKRIADIIVEINNNRTGYFGKLRTDVDSVLSGLNMEYTPVFATKEYNTARFFGEPHILVPNSNFSIYINDKVDDILAATRDKDDIIENLINGYKEYKNQIPQIKRTVEIIFSCKSYYLISSNQLLGQHTRKSKYATIKKKEDLILYSDVIKLYNEYVSYWKWWYEQREGEASNVF